MKNVDIPRQPGGIGSPDRPHVFFPPLYIRPTRPKRINQILLAMKLTVFFLTAVLLHVSAKTVSQKVSFSGEKVPLERVFDSVEVQTGYFFLYDELMIRNSFPVTIEASDMKLEDFLKAVFKTQPLSFTVKRKNIIIARKPFSSDIDPLRVEVVQDIIVTGSVVDEQNAPLEGASIKIKGTDKGTVADAKGAFSLAAPNRRAIIVVSFIGYESREYRISESTTLNIVLKPDASGMSDVVVVGYGTSRARDVTGAITSVNASEISQRAPTNAFEAMQGLMSGVQITTSSGAPGAGASLRIRGVSTFEGGVNPLYIVDGQPVESIDNINPNDIKTIEVLKDGSSAAIYGSRSANGVVIITTRSGQKGKTEINVSYLKSISQARIMPVATTNQRLKYELFQGNLPTPMIDTLNQLYYNNYNFQDLMYRTAHRDQVNVSLLSGSDKTRFYWNTGFENQQGIIRTTKFMRVTSRLNIDHSFNDRITVGTKLNLSYGQQKNIDEEIERNLVGQTLSKPSFSEIYEIDGAYLDNTRNYRGEPNALREYDLMDIMKSNLGGNIFNYAEIRLLKDLKYRANIGVEFNSYRNSWFFPEYVFAKDDIVRSSFQSSLGWNWIHESFFNYDKTFGSHKISGVAGFSAQKWNNPEERISAILANGLISTLNNATEILISDTYSRNEKDHSLASVFARLSYNFRDKYLVSGTFRRDGSSRFGPQNKWGNFPSISMGWRFSEESFMKGVGFIRDAKIRAGLAITGNERIGNRDFDMLLTTGNFYNGVNGTGLSARLANPGIKWEETVQKNIGVDLSFLNGRLTLTTDFYIKDTRGLLANQPLPAETGLENVRVNLGNVQNKGFEAALQAIPYQSGDFRWKTNFNISRNTVKVKKMAGGVPVIGANHITQEGMPLGSFFGYRILGVFPYDQSNAFTPQGERLDPKFENGNFVSYELDGKAYSGAVKQISVGGVVSKGGDFYWKDNDGNFVIDGQDREILGNPYPKYYGGFRNEFTYKNFSFSFLFDFQFDVQVYNNFMQWTSQLRANALTPIPYVLENFWQGPGDQDAIFPGFVRRNQNQLGETAPTSYWIEDADYIKLRNVKLSYAFSGPLLKKAGMSLLTVYTALNSPLVWTNYRGVDPELNADNNTTLSAGVDMSRYPRKRELLLGINVNF